MSFLKRLKKPSEQMANETRKFKKVAAILNSPDLVDFETGLSFVRQKRKGTPTVVQRYAYIVAWKDMEGWTNYLFSPHDYVFDGASIPKSLQPLLGSSLSPRYLIAAYFHDYLYSEGQFDRQFADELFYLLLRKYGVSALKASLFFLGVRTFGILFKK